MKQFELKEKIIGKVLVAEDEPAILEVYARTLARHGVNVVKAHDGQEALDLFQKESDVSIVITDVDMPRKNGLELIMAANKMRPLTQFVVITGKLDDAIALYGVKRNVVCLPKPVEPDFVVVATAASAVRYRDQLWEDALKKLTLAPDWNPDTIFAVLRKAPWFSQG